MKSTKALAHLKESLNMYSIVQRCVLPQLNQEKRQELLTQAHLMSLAEIFEAMVDPRGRHG